jgi:chemotaxis signal transduction protein
MENNTLEQMLINALSRLQNAEVDREILPGQEQANAQHVAEQHFNFVIGPHQFVVRASCFCEVFVDIPIAAVPNAPMLFAGLCNVRGVLVPVYQLHSKWSAQRPARVHVFCIGKGEKTVGILVDALPVSLALSAQDSIIDDTLNDDEVLASLVEQTFLVRQVPRHRVDGDSLGSQLLALVNSSKGVVTGMDTGGSYQQMLEKISAVPLRR